MKPLTRNLLVVAAGTVIVFGAIYFLVIRKTHRPPGNQENVSNEQPFLNLAKDVKYVGDEECYDCHADIYNSFKKTAMGKSFYEPGKEVIMESPQIVFDPNTNFYYSIFKEGDNFYQMEFKKDKAGKIIHKLIRKVDYVIGSGEHTKSYVSSDNGFLYELPLTWYVQKKKWDLSPGYQRKNLRFSRAMNQECLNCHNSYPEYVEHTENRFKEKLPLGIGCERCHGPGELHVKFRSNESSAPLPKGEPDRTIINSRRLDMRKQLDVCFQCHLEGDVHVFKEGKKQNDFRPGMNLSDIKAVYFHENINPGDFKIASHGARMSMSECFRKSGKMLCTTCHDPHVPVEWVARSQFNGKCKSCHNTDRLTPGMQKSNIDHRENADCISCHMRQGGTSDIPHVNFTDHWIRKEIKLITKNDADSLMSPPQAGALIFKEFYSDSALSSVVRSVQIDSLSEIYLAIAYVKYFDEKHNSNEYLNRAIPMLERGLHYFPRNEGALYYLGIAYAHQRKYADAERHLRNLVNVNPLHVSAYYQLGTVLEKMNRLPEAIDAYQNAVNIVPAHFKSYTALGNIYSHQGNTQKALDSYLQVIKIFSGYSVAYNNLGNLYLQSLNDTANARKYLEEALKLDPDFVMAILNLGNLELAEGNDKEAEKLFKKIIEINEKFIPAYGNLAVIYERRGKKEEAVKYLNKLLEIDPNDVNARRMMERLKK